MASTSRMGGTSSGCAAQTGGSMWAIVQLAMLLIAMWSLLSQLLQWSDAAVMRIPPQYDQRDQRDPSRSKSPTPKSERTRKEDGAAREDV